MRQRKVITIDNREIEIKEITVREIRNFLQDMETEPTPGIEGIYVVLTRFMPTCVNGITIEDLEDMPPSDIEKVYNTFREVNAVFFKAANLFQGENQLIIRLREAIVPLLMMRFAALYLPAIPEPGNTDTDSSQPHSESIMKTEPNSSAA